MKNLLFFLVFMSVAFIGPNLLAGPSPSDAKVEVEESTDSPLNQKLKEQKESPGFLKKLERLQRKLEKKAAKAKEEDNTKTWFALWLGAWGVGLLMVIAGYVIVALTYSAGVAVIGSLLALLGWLVGLFGTASMIVWLVKKFG